MNAIREIITFQGIIMMTHGATRAITCSLESHLTNNNTAHCGFALPNKHQDRSPGNFASMKYTSYYEINIRRI